MTAKQTKTAQTVETSSDREAIDRIMAALDAPKGDGFSFSSFFADKAADAGVGLARLGAGAAAGLDNAKLSFAAERERQRGRSRAIAAKLLAAARASAA